jgi:hypothetical protein
LDPVLEVVAVNDAVFEPAETVTVAGTVASLREADKLTVKLPVGADVKVTVPVVEHPAVTVLGDKVNDERESSVTVRIAFAEEFCGLTA